jgi:fructose-1,6-bisphosphatase I
LRKSSLSGLTGSTETVNVQGETQKPLDVVSNEILLRACRMAGSVRFAVSEELPREIEVAPDGQYAVIFDPLDGSSNLDVNVTVGTILSVVSAGTTADILQSGRGQLFAAYAAYGPQTTLVLTFGKTVEIFSLDDQGTYHRSSADVRICPDSAEFSINAARKGGWDDVISSYVDRAVERPGGNMRWVGSMVADAHRILNRGGVFLYPSDSREPDVAGRLRLLYEANPMALIVEAAGGMATTGDLHILDLVPRSLHQRVPLIFGSRNEVEVLAALYRRQTEDLT